MCNPRQAIHPFMCTSSYITRFPSLQVIEHHTNTPLDQRVYIAALLLPLILLGFVPNLKYLAPVSMIANLFMAVGLGITIYYLVQDIPDASTRPQFNASVNTIPQFFSIVIFAMEAIGVVSI